MHLPEPVKKYWPLGVGAIIGIIVIAKMNGASASSGTSDVASYLAAQTAAGAATQQAALQSQAQQAAIDLQNNQLQDQYNLGVATLTSQNYAANNAAQVQFVAAQASMAQAIGSAVGSVVDALNTPAIAAINSASVENQTALAAAAGVANTSFLAKVANVKAVASIPTTMAQSAAVAAQANAQVQTNAANNATAQNASNNNSNAQMLGTVASIAALALL